MAETIGAAVARCPTLSPSCELLSRGSEVRALSVLAAVVNTTVVAVENLTVGSTVWLPAESDAPGR